MRTHAGFLSNWRKTKVHPPPKKRKKVNHWLQSRISSSFPPQPSYVPFSQVPLTLLLLLNCNLRVVVNGSINSITLHGMWSLSFTERNCRWMSNLRDFSSGSLRKSIFCCFSALLISMPFSCSCCYHHHHQYYHIFIIFFSLIWTAPFTIRMCYINMYYYLNYISSHVTMFNTYLFVLLSYHFYHMIQVYHIIINILHCRITWHVIKCYLCF